jgi:hypothetical protein
MRQLASASQAQCASMQLASDLRQVILGALVSGEGRARQRIQA